MGSNAGDAAPGRDNVFDSMGAGSYVSQRPPPRRGGAVEYAFGQVDMPKAELHATHRSLFEQYDTMAGMLLRSGLILPALDYCRKCSHMFDLLDASGGIGDGAHGLYPPRPPGGLAYRKGMGRTERDERRGTSKGATGERAAK